MFFCTKAEFLSYGKKSFREEKKPVGQGERWNKEGEAEKKERAGGKWRM